MKAKFLSALLALTMVLSLLPTAVLADDKEDTLPTAENDVITLDSNVSISKWEVTKNVTLDLSGYTFTTGDCGVDISNGATLTITDSGKNGTLTSSGTPICVEGDNSKVIINGGAIVSTNNYGTYAKDGGTAIINGGTVHSCYAALSGNNTTGNMNFEINGGTLTADNGPAIYMPGQVTLKITDGTLNGGISLRMGQVNISGGTINSITTGIDSPSEYYNYSGNAWLPDALYVFGGTYDKGDEVHGNSLNLNITGGKFNCLNDQGSAVAIYDLGKVEQDANVTITDGTFTTASTTRSAYQVLSLQDIGVTSSDADYGKAELVGKVKSTISGGTFSDLNSAIAYAAKGAIIKLADNTTEDVVIPAGKDITLDLNGHKLSNVKDHTITNNGTLIITGDGTVDNISHGKAALYNNAGATATLNGGTFERSEDLGTAVPDSANGNSWYTVKNYGTMTINKGVTITNKGSFSSAVVNGWYDASKAGSNGEPSHTANAILNINGGSISGGKITVKNDDYGYLTITDGTFTQPTNGLYCIYNANVTAISGGTVDGAVGSYNGTSTAADQGKLSITGGYFTVDPSAYVDDNHYVVESNKAGYVYMVTSEEPTEVPVIVKDSTDVTVPENSNLTAADIANITANTEVDGVAEAVAGSKDTLVKNSGIDTTKDSVAKVEVSVEVTVEVTDADLNAENPTMTFTATPVATVTTTDANGKVIDTKSGVKVPNRLLNGEITVTLPLPEGFTPKQIKHISDNGSVEYFINKTEGSKRDAEAFEIVNGCAVFTIDHFSTFELSGTVTYVEPSRHPSSSSGSSISVGKTENGTITVSPKTASKGETVTITVKPADGYELDRLTATDANGDTIRLTEQRDGTYTFTMPAGKVEVNGTFVKQSAQTFVDVPENAYYAPAVAWAVEKGVTEGTSATTFSPDAACTRAQIVTFLYRAAGSPAIKSAVNPFTDVSASDYYYNAVLWAVENGITTGTSETTFSPNESCTRAQCVTFLYRAVGSAATAKASFTDVSADAYYAPAVDWAVENGVTEGTSATTFSPDNACTRAQIVTFLYRAYQGK